jgi:hypothetical protein
MHVFRHVYRQLVSTEESWFCADTAGVAADILRIYSSPRPPDRGRSVPQHTIVIDLSREERVLWDGMTKETRYEIRRAERDQVGFGFHRERSADWLGAFAEEYAQLRIRKNLEPLRTWRLEDLARRNMIVASTSEDVAGRPLSWHVYVSSQRQARLLHSVSGLGRQAEAKQRAAVGRANRFHHWRDMLAFKAEGKTTYDLGGAYQDTEDAAKAAITSFKKNFGGTESVVYDAVVPLTWRGKLALLASQGLRHLPIRQRKPLAG